MVDVKVQKVATVDDRSLPVFREAEELMRRIQERAFDLFCGRGFGDGSAFNDWLAAEREICWAAGELAEQDKDYVLSVALPGFEPGDVSVTATPRELIVRASAKSERKEEPKKGEGGKVWWSELGSCDVYRRVELAQDIDVKKVSASLKNGLLKIVAEKLEKPQRTAPASATA